MRPSRLPGGIHTPATALHFYAARHAELFLWLHNWTLRDAACPEAPHHNPADPVLRVTTQLQLWLANPVDLIPSVAERQACVLDAGRKLEKGSLISLTYISV